jgi:hypothetical protein
MSNPILEAILWERVQAIYAKSTHYRAGDNPEFARALAAFDRVANLPQTQTNVIPLQLSERSAPRA